MRLSFIIVNYKVEKEVLKLIQSILNFCDIKSYEIIIIENSEREILKKLIKKIDANIRLIKSKTNVGYGAGNNLGAKIATGDVLFFINPDTEIFDGKVSELLDLLDDKRVGAIAPLLFSESKNLYQQGTKILTPIRAFFSLSLLSRILPHNKVRDNYYLEGKVFAKKTRVDVVPGTAFVIKKSLFVKIGGFDENFFLYFEEFDLCKRLTELGYKNYISNLLKITHKLGESTRKKKGISRIFKESRFYYFRKNFGFILGVITEFVLRVRTQHILLFLIVCMATFLRFYKLDELMIFLGDQGWFYLSAVELIKTGNIPLVGIPSSVVWLHQGPLATYFIALSLLIGGFNPIAPAVLFSTFDVITVFIIYLLGKKLFNRWVGLLSSFFYATSPLVLIAARTPYHTSLIPLFVSIFILLIVNLNIKKERIYYFFIFLVLGLLIQLELSNAVLFIFIVSLFLIKYLKFRRKILFSSAAGFIIGILPFVIFDLTHNFVQTLGFPLWVINRSRLFLGISLSDDATTSNTPRAIKTVFDQLSALFSTDNNLVIVLFISAMLVSLFFINKLKEKNSYFLILLAFVIPLLGFFIHSAPGVAYFPVLFPVVALIVGYISYLLSYKMKFVYLLLVVLGVINSYSMLKNDFFISNSKSEKVLPVNNYSYGFSHQLPLEVSNYISSKVVGSVHLDGKGVLGLYPSSMDNIKYFLETKNVDTQTADGQKIIISDHSYNLENPDFSNSVYKLKFDEETNN